MNSGRWLIFVLALMAALRAVALVLPTTHLWGLNAARFLPMWLGGAMLALSIAALHPALARASVPALDALGRGRRPALFLPMAALALLVAFPNRLWFVGDYLLRLGVVSQPGEFTTMFPQALPLDQLWHYDLPRALGGLLHIAPDAVERGLAVLEGAALALASMYFARVLNLDSAPALAVAAVVLFGGYFTLFSGYGKATLELCLLRVMIGTFGVRLVRDDRSAVAFGVATACALAFHRSAWGLLPGIAFGWLLWFRSHARGGAWRSPRVLIAIAIPLVTIAILLSRVVHLVRDFDLPLHLQTQAVEEQGGLLRVALSELKLLNVANAILLLSPLALAALGLPFMLGRGVSDRGTAMFLFALVILRLPGILLVQVRQGLFRDWDVFASAGVGISLCAAWVIAEALRRGPERKWLSVPILAAVVTTTLALLFVSSFPEAGMRRVRAFLDEPPRRPEEYRIATLDFIGLRSMRLHRWAEAAQAYREVAAAAPSPRALEFWGVNAAIAGGYRDSEQAFQLLSARDSSNAMGWVGLWMSATLAGDTTEAGRARSRVMAYVPNGPEDRAVQERIRRSPELGALLQNATIRDREYHQSHTIQEPR